MNITRKFRISLHLLKGKSKARAIGAYAKFTEMPPASARYLLTQAPHQLCVMGVASFRECVVDETELNQVKQALQEHFEVFAYPAEVATASLEVAGRSAKAAKPKRE